MHCKFAFQATYFMAICMSDTVRALMAPKGISNLRIELFFRNIDDLKERVKFLASKGVKSFNIVNKSNRDELVNWRNIIREEIPDSDICLHYSLKYNKCRRKDGAFLLLTELLDGMSSQSPMEESESTHHTIDGGKDEVLIITGSGPKGKLNSVTAIERLGLRERGELNFLKSNHSVTKVAIAFNPFFPISTRLCSGAGAFVKKNKFWSSLQNILSVWYRSRQITFFP